MVIAGTVLALMNARCLPTKKISLQSGISSKSDLFVSPLKRMPFHNVPFVSAIDYIRARISLAARSPDSMAASMPRKVLVVCSPAK